MRLLFATLGLSACSSPASPVEFTAAPLVYGDDDRVEAFASEDGAFAALAMDRAVAITLRTTIDASAGVARLTAPTLSEAAGVCASEPYAQQPTGALCSGLLIGPQSVLTAGHCVREVPCEAMRLVRRFAYEREGELAALGDDDVYGCAEVVALQRSAPTDDERLDYAWIRLDRPVPDIDDDDEIEVREPTAVLEPDEPLRMFGFPEGVPLKLDFGPHVTDARANTLDYFISTTDSFHGSSGSPMFDANMRLVGIQNRGADDYAPTAAGCLATVHTDDDAEHAREEATYAFRALDGLCEQAPSAEPCAPTPSTSAEPSDGGCAVAHTHSQPPSHAAAIVWLLAATRLARRHRRLSVTGHP